MAYFWNHYENGKEQWCLSCWDGSLETKEAKVIWLTKKEERLLDKMPREIRHDWYLDNESRAVLVTTKYMLPF